MTAAAKLPCPRCKHVLDSLAWHDTGHGRCWHCEKSFEFFPFPALGGARAPVVTAAPVLGEEAVCFFHAENRADAICDDCGRLLCSVCQIEFAGKKVCPSCIASSRAAEATPAIRERVLYDRIAFSLSVLPILIWPFTAITAPATLGFVAFGWSKPGSIVGGHRRLRLCLAALIAIAEIAGWVILFTHFPHAHPRPRPVHH